MANLVWTSTNGSWNNVASWDGGTVPVANDDAYFLSGSQSVTAGLDQSLVNGVRVHVGTEYKGSIGNSAADALDTGTSWLFDFNGRMVPQAFLNVGNTSSIVVRATSDQADALHVDGGGVAAEVTLLASRNVSLASTLTLGNLYLLTSAAFALLKSGLTLTNAYVQAGSVISLAAVTNVYMRGGRWRHEGASTNNVALLQMSGGVFEILGCKGATFTVMDVFGGFVDASRDENNKTISGGIVYAGGVANLDNRANTITAALVRRGGRIIGGSNVTITETVAEVGGPQAG